MGILAIDPATACGWAHSAGPSGVWDLRILRDESDGMRLIRMRSKLREIFLAHPFNLLVFEAARNAMPKMQGALVVQAQIQSVVKVWCIDHEVQFRGYSPTEIKRHATGRGNANKAEMIAAAKLRWPSVPIIDDNHADALWILSLAVATYEQEKTQETSTPTD